MAELLTRKIAKEYMAMAGRLPPNGLQDIGDRRKLRIELQDRCNLREIEAINVINGRNIGLYIRLSEIREEERLTKGKEGGDADGI